MSARRTAPSSTMGSGGAAMISAMRVQGSPARAGSGRSQLALVSPFRRFSIATSKKSVASPVRQHAAQLRVPVAPEQRLEGNAAADGERRLADTASPCSVPARARLVSMRAAKATAAVGQEWHVRERGQAADVGPDRREPVRGRGPARSPRPGPADRGVCGVSSRP